MASLSPSSQMEILLILRADFAMSFSTVISTLLLSLPSRFAFQVLHVISFEKPHSLKQGEAALLGTPAAPICHGKGL